MKFVRDLISVCDTHDTSILTVYCQGHAILRYIVAVKKDDAGIVILYSSYHSKRNLIGTHSLQACQIIACIELVTTAF